MATPWYKSQLFQALAVGGFLGLLLWEKDAVKDVIVRGRRLTTTTVDANGVVPVAPVILAQEASRVLGYPASVDMYSFARMLRSEGIGEGEIRGHVLLNDLADLGWSSITQLVTYSTSAAKKGYYGKQATRRYSTAQDPYEGDFKLAVKVYTDHTQGIDPTMGAVKFVDKSGLLTQAGARGYDQLVAEWGRDGLRPYNVPGYGTDLVVFRKEA